MRRLDPNSSERARRGITLIEVLVVVGIIGLLITLVIVGLAAASSRAASARTIALMTAMNQGFSQFEQDHGRLPQVLDANRDLAPLPGNFAQLQDWFSVTTPAEYLLGYGGAAQDGAYGLGLRDPGTDALWSATALNGLLADRTPNTNGRVYGPYLQLTDERLVGNLDVNTGRVLLPTDSGYDVLQQQGAPKVIVDYWGEPIRFYMRHPNRQIGDLGDVVLLRPYNIDAGADVVGAADARGDTGTTTALKAATIALFSPGPDRTGNALYRYDDPADTNTDGVNADNLVEIGQ